MINSAPDMPIDPFAPELVSEQNRDVWNVVSLVDWNGLSDIELDKLFRYASLIADFMSPLKRENNMERKASSAADMSGLGLIDNPELYGEAVTFSGRARRMINLYLEVYSNLDYSNWVSLLIQNSALRQKLQEVSDAKNQPQLMKLLMDSTNHLKQIESRLFASAAIRQMAVEASLSTRMYNFAERMALIE